MKKVVGYGWCGEWADGGLGFLMSPHIAHGKRNAERLSTEQRGSLSGKSRLFATSDFYRVRVTLEAMKDKRGKLIVRRASKATDRTNHKEKP